MIASFCILYTFKKALLRHLYQFPGLPAHFSNHMGSGCIGLISLPYNTCIQADDISFFQIAVLIRNAVNHLIVNRYTHRCRKTLIIQKGWNTSMTSYHIFTHPVDFFGRHSRYQGPAKLLMNLGKYTPCFPH